MVMFEEVREGDELPPLVRTVTREDVAAYAEASGDHNPLHLDDGFARSVGFDGIIAHGMFTMAHLAAAVIRWAGQDATVVSIGSQFRAPVSIGDAIVAGGRVGEVDQASRTVRLDLRVSLERDGATEWPIRRGDAEVVFPRHTG
jgi:acyl dehydratase